MARWTLMRLAMAGTAVSASVAMTAAPAQADLMSSCRGDYTRFCLGTLPGDGRVARCLAAQRGQLSEACGRALDAAASCRPEIERFCRTAGSPGALKSCLEARRSELGLACAANLKLL